MLAEIILTNGLQYNGRDLKTLAEKYCGVELDKSVRGEIITKGLNNAVLLYGARDVEFLLTIKRKQLAYLKELDLLSALALDNSFVVVLAYIEYCGIKLDFNKWSKRTSENIKKATILKQELSDILWKDKKYSYFSGMASMFDGAQDCTLNWDSPKQVLKLFNEYGIVTTIANKGVEKKTVNEKVLRPQENDFPILKVYLEYKELQKDISTYGNNWRKYINPITGRIHTTYQQLMNTGRLSCGNKNDESPNLQNVPNDELARSCFIPESGNIMIDCDYSGQEQIILANFSKEKNLLEFYRKGFKEFHSYVAFLIYPEVRTCSLDEITPEALQYVKDNFPTQRKTAKSAGFAISYGGNGATIARNCNISKKEGESVYNSYFSAFPDMKLYFDKVFQQAASNGYITFNNITRRKYFFDIRENDYFALRDKVESPYFWSSEPDAVSMNKRYNMAKSEMQRIAQNYPIQGSASDTTKYAGILFFNEILKHKWFNIVKIVNDIHDEYLVECPKELCEEVESLLVSCMEKAGEPFCKIVKLKAEAQHGNCWVH